VSDAKNSAVYPEKIFHLATGNACGSAGELHHRMVLVHLLTPSKMIEGMAMRSPDLLPNSTI
jgi:hypothetical protein